jgi:uncharacterized membrane protein YgcG
MILAAGITESLRAQCPNPIMLYMATGVFPQGKCGIPDQSMKPWTETSQPIPVYLSGSVSCARTTTYGGTTIDEGYQWQGSFPRPGVPPGVSCVPCYPVWGSSNTTLLATGRVTVEQDSGDEGVGHYWCPDCWECCDFPWQGCTNATGDTGLFYGGLATLVIAGEEGATGPYTNTWSYGAEYTDEEMRVDLIARLPAFPTDWSKATEGDASEAEFFYWDGRHWGANGARMQFRLKLPPCSIKGAGYTVGWTEKKFDQNGNLISATPQTEKIVGSGDPANPVMGQVHLVDVPTSPCQIMEMDAHLVSVTPPGGGGGSGPGGGGPGGGGPGGGGPGGGGPGGGGPSHGGSTSN